MDLIVITCRALASKPRLRLLRAIHEQPGRTIQVLADELGLPLPVASKHLRSLRNLHLIQTVPSGRYVRCSPAAANSTTNQFLQEVQRLLSDLFGKGKLKSTLAQVWISVPAETLAWDSVFDAVVKHATVFTHLRRLLILRWLASGGACATEQIQAGVGMSIGATRRQLNKLQRRGVIAFASGPPTTWTLVRLSHPPFRRRLLEIVLRSLKQG